MAKFKNTAFLEIQRNTKRDVSTWKPLFFRLNEEGEAENDLNDLLTSREVFITNDIESQLQELIKSRNPKEKMSNAVLREAIANHVGSVPIDSYGVWVYYPWSHRLVHLLDEEEFVEVRTNRNHYKITREEHQVLATKIIGLVGLSVGQSVALTMAMERSFGELRLADFDVLELTNLNRIRTGVHNLGIPKLVVVAREIMEIDPYLNLTCYSEGLTEENMDRFFTEGGPLDLLIDECDGLDMKVLSRWKARKMKIPVVMEASDRGMIDVERFDLEPGRPLLHGMIEDLDPAKLKGLETNEDKMPYMLDIVGLETISTRAQASMLEIGETISTWPQLASAVTLGGGVTADVVRRILLGSFTESGRYYVDVEQLIANGVPSMIEVSSATPHVLRRFSMPDEDFGPELPIATDPILDKKEIETIIKAACHAPSGGNLQPWKWSSNGLDFRLKRDEALTGGFLDHREMATHVALGATLENADLALKGKGYGTQIDYFPLPDRPDVVADLKAIAGSSIDRDDAFLADHIFDRETNRNIENSPAIHSNHLDLLQRVSSKYGSGLTLIEDPTDLKEIAEVIAFAERFRIMHPEGQKNFNHEMRWTPDEAAESGSGIDVATVDITVGERAGFQLAQNPEVINKLIEWNGGSAFEKLSRKSTAAAAALGIITRPEHDRLQHLMAGRDMERTWIAANAQGLAFQPQSPITFILQRLIDRSDLNDRQLEELSEANDRLLSTLQKYTSDSPVFIFRLFYGTKKVVRSMRRNGKLHFRPVK